MTVPLSVNVIVPVGGTPRAEPYRLAVAVTVCPIDADVVPHPQVAKDVCAWLTFILIAGLVLAA